MAEFALQFHICFPSTPLSGPDGKHRTDCDTVYLVYLAWHCGSKSRSFGQGGTGLSDKLVGFG